MKKIILTVLMVVVLATPCVAEVEPEGMFSIEGTYWSGTGTFQERPIIMDLAFSAGIIYACNPMSCSDLSYTTSSYADFFLLTIVEVILSEDSIPLNVVLFPFFGIGWGTVLHSEGLVVLNYKKLTDNWIPPSE